MTERTGHAAPAEAPPARRGIPVAGIVLVGLGVLLLLQTTGVVPWRAWLEIWRLWPVLLIAIGANLILGRRFPVLAGVIVLVLLVGAIAGAAVLAATDGRPLVTSSFRAPIEGTQAADVSVTFGAGQLAVRSLPAKSQDLIDARFETPGREAEVTLSRANAAASLDITMAGGTFFGVGQAGNWDIALSQAPDLQLRLNGGAADMALDLRELRVTRLDVSIGAANANIGLPAEAGETVVTVSSGASSITLDVPAGVAAHITSSSGLSSINIDTSRFPRTDDGWQSPDYATAANRVDIDLRVGAADVTVR